MRLWFKSRPNQPWGVLTKHQNSAVKHLGISWSSDTENDFPKRNTKELTIIYIIVYLIEDFN